MAFNLITDAWIPVKRKSGKRETIRPFEITDNMDDPIITLDFPRPDFNGSVIQFLIGLMQTTSAPEEEDDWWDWFENPPKPATLQKDFAKVEHAFNLDGDGPRFMQDISILNENEAKIDSINELLIETPGSSTIKKNTDHFIKRNNTSGLCIQCCAASIFNLQTNSPEGGRGHYTSIRGGGPLTTIILGDTLWKTMGLNILSVVTFKSGYGDVKKTDDKYLFPWLNTANFIMAKKDRPISSSDTASEHLFWGMPRRIWIDFANGTSGNCQVCGSDSDSLITNYNGRPNGIQYDDSWMHPLSPYKRDNEGPPMPDHARGAVKYRRWLGLIQPDDHDLKKREEPARVVTTFFNHRSNGANRFRLWAYGYDMNKDKARCWHEGVMPLIHVHKDVRDIYEKIVAGLILAADEVGRNLSSAIKNAWFKRPKDAKGDFGFVNNSFWQETEAPFYETLSDLKSALEADEDNTPIRLKWHKILCAQSIKIFDTIVLSSPIEDSDPKRISLARRNLEKFNHKSKIKELLDLPLPEKKTKAKNKKPVEA